MGRKRYFPLLKFAKRQVGPLVQRVSANVVADCSFSMGKKINKRGISRKLSNKRSDFDNLNDFI